MVGVAEVEAEGVVFGGREIGLIEGNEIGEDARGNVAGEVAEGNVIVEKLIGGFELPVVAGLIGNDTKLIST